MGNSISVKFWSDQWIGDIKLMDQFGRLYALENNKHVTVAERLGSVNNSEQLHGNDNFTWEWARPIRGRSQSELISLKSILSSVQINSNIADKWKWSLNSDGVFTTKSLALLIDEKRSRNLTSFETLRNKAIPQKIGISIWRAQLNRIPVRVELDKRGIDLDSILYPLCSNESKTVEHSLVQCSQVLKVWQQFFKWWNLSYVSHISLDQAFDDSSLFSSLSNIGKIIWQGTKWTVCYALWKARNEKIFKNRSWNESTILTYIQTSSFAWISKRLKKCSLD
ncbi:uncharacterized protein [Rutidosis leptorrhynchoides]|uniref:uncharacterized protein n=1 Tax=Rutidosis leptorrhynchoides TaxID=125765 RepID=UPI003A99E478